jgi:drug/metabolite transporter (DMT)-like permease
MTTATEAAAPPQRAGVDVGGLALAMGGGICFALTPILGKKIQAHGVSTVGLLLVRFGIASASLVVLRLVRRNRRPIPVRWGAVAFAIGCVGYLVETACYFTALRHASASLVQILLYSYPLLVTVISAMLLRRRPSTTVLGCLVLAVGGAALSVGAVGRGASAGVVLALASALTLSIYIVVSSRVSVHLAATDLTMLVMTGTAVAYALVAIVVHLGGSRFPQPHFPSGSTAWGLVLVLSTVCTVVAMTMFMAGVARLGPSNASVVATVEPLTTAALSVVWLHEALRPGQVVGGAMIIAAVIVLARTTRRRPTVTRRGAAGRA